MSANRFLSYPFADFDPLSGNFERLVLFVHTHADKDRGDLWYSGDGIHTPSTSTNIKDVSSTRLFLPPLTLFVLTFHKFFEEVVGERLRDYIAKRSNSVMFLAACGTVVSNPQALRELQGVVDT